MDYHGPLPFLYPTRLLHEETVFRSSLLGYSCLFTQSLCCEHSWLTILCWDVSLPWYHVQEVRGKSLKWWSQKTVYVEEKYRFFLSGSKVVKTQNLLLFSLTFVVLLGFKFFMVIYLWIDFVFIFLSFSQETLSACTKFRVYETWILLENCLSEQIFYIFN